MTAYEALLRLYAWSWATTARVAHRARLHALTAHCEHRWADRIVDAVEVAHARTWTPVCPACGHRHHPEEP